VVTRLEGKKDKIRFVSGHLVQIPGNWAKKKGEGENKKGVGRLASPFIFFQLRYPGQAKKTSRRRLTMRRSVFLLFFMTVGIAHAPIFEVVIRLTSTSQ